RYSRSGNREVFTYGDGYPAITGPVGKETYQFGTINHRSDKWALDSKHVSTWTVVDGVRHELRMEHVWDEDLEEVVPVWVYECDYPTLGDMIGGKTCRTARYHIGSDGSAGHLANETTQSALAEGGILTVTDLKTTYDYDQSAALTAMRQECATRRYVYDGTDVYGTLVYWTEEEYEPETETWVLRSKSVTELDDATGQTLLATTDYYDGGIQRSTYRYEYAYDQLGRCETYVSYYGYGTEPNPSVRKESEYEGEWSHPCRVTSYRYDRDAGEWAKSEVAEWEYDYGVGSGEVASYNSSLQAGCPYLCRSNKTMSYNGGDTPASVTTVRYGYSELPGDSGIGSVASGHASGERAVEVYSLAGIRLGRYPSLGEARLSSGLYIA
ncbi:MAG: hypothetical protein K2G30_09525, partial [Muribaculaceae bacterium]|nr:hypothetical protein [Muribaculaceae bacterium]